ncbi:hypothetical protein DEO72_LG2g3579 [Vigna unguiculata]|uniref:Uncharacterized protein n=1 Tax=Vigna unguiculata TaxID=3917 RepID=A0A4D6L421_VIGUN|nr:hypothetical protein DEO72_LG2g3579 [Vigna unguiculata]
MQNLDRDMAAALPSPLALPGDLVALRFTPRKTLLHLRLLLRFSSAFKIGAAPIHFAAVRSRSPDTAVSEFSRLKVVVAPAVTVKGNADAAGARGLCGSSSRDHHSSVHVTTRDHTPVQSFESPPASSLGQNGDVMLRRWLYEWVRYGVGLGSRGIGMEDGFFGVSKMPTALE